MRKAWRAASRVSATSASPCAVVTKAASYAIPLNGAVDADDVIAVLAEAAALSIQRRRKETEQPYLGAAKAELDEFIAGFEKLGSWARDAIDNCLVKYDIDLTDVAEAVRDVQDWRFDDLQATGRPRNDAAFRFVIDCYRIWCRAASKPPPKRANKSSSFYQFVKAAMPPEVHGGDEITGIVRNALDYLNSSRRLFAF